ncbi:MAG: DUF2786 domain-containing protein [Ilumatobacteraceae bacterium]|jgi:hypothetical protein|nr:DUF2786 domain-containing protein [Ilumatobacteraceae bacterium]
MTSPTAPLDDAVVLKVRKLLAMAERSPHPEEADAFSRKAAELIAAHRLDPARLRVASVEGVTHERVLLGRGAYVRGRLALLSAIARAHDGAVVFEVGPQGTVALVAGHRADLDAILLLYGSLHLQAASRMASVTKATGAATQRWRRAFLFGFADEVGRMLAASAAETAARVDPTGATLPARRARAAEVKDYTRRAFGPIHTARAPAPAQAAGVAAGREAASRSDLGRARVAGRPQLGRGSAA